MMLKNLLFIWIFGIIGISGRYGIDLLLSRDPSTTFPIHTFIINILGSFLLGMVFALTLTKPSFSSTLYIGLSVGLLGGFTTFSTFSLQTLLLLQRNDFWNALLYGLGSPLIGLLAAFLGLRMGSLL